MNCVEEFDGQIDQSVMMIHRPKNESSLRQ